MKFDYSEANTGHGVYPSVDESIHMKAEGNLQYLKFIDLIKYLWEKSHPDIFFLPHASNHVFDPDKGYILYGLESRATAKDYAKPRPIEVIKDTASGMDYEISMQAFDNYISFTSIHKDPRTAEEIIESFEDFMMEFTPRYKQLGIGDIFYSRRFSDREESRVGQNVNSRTVVYRTIIQKTKLIARDRIKEIEIDMKVWWKNYGQA